MKDCDKGEDFASRIYSNTNTSTLFLGIGRKIFLILYFKNNCVITKSSKGDITRTTNLFVKYDRNLKPCLTTSLDIKIFSNAGVDSNVLTTCMPIGDGFNLKQKAGKIM